MHDCMVGYAEHSEIQRTVAATQTDGIEMVDINDGSLGRVSPLLPRGYVDVVEASTAGYPGDTLIKTDKNNIAPRLGFAYRPWGGATVVRGGFGIFYDVVTRAANSGAAPFVINEPSFTNPAANPVVILPRVFPAAGVAGPHR